MNQVVPIAETKDRPPVRVVENRIAVFDTANFEHMQRIATLMATCALVPDPLRGKVADCFLIVNQARSWNMDPFAVAQCTSIVNGKLCFEGKLVAAAVAGDPNLEGRLRYELSGTGDQRKIRVIGKVRGNSEECVVEGTVAQWRTKNEQWTKDPDQMLTYRGTRQWARRFLSDRLLGVYAPDEFDEDTRERWPRREPRDITPPPAPVSPPPAPPKAPAAAPETAVIPPPPPKAPDAGTRRTGAVDVEPVVTTPTVIMGDGITYDERISDWEVRLKAASRNEQEELFEAEIEPFREAGGLFPPDYNRLMGLIKDA